MKLVIATPVGGSIPATCHLARQQLYEDARNGGLPVDTLIDSEDLMVPRDIVRARSRIVRKFLEGDGTHLLFLDVDVVVNTAAVASMIAANKPFVASTYPRRLIDWNGATAAARAGKHAVEGAFQWVHYAGKCMATGNVPPGLGEHDGTSAITITSIGLGCALIQRGLLQTLTDQAFQVGQQFIDSTVEGDHPTAALFDLMRVDDVQFSEDFSFCYRVRTWAGERVWMSLQPVGHMAEVVLSAPASAILSLF
jgi:hypothetical protein